MRALVSSALLGASLWACALPEARKVSGAEGGNGGSAGGQGGVVGSGGSAGGGEGLGRAISFMGSCASAEPDLTMDLAFNTAAFTVELWYHPTGLPPPGDYHALVTKGGANESNPGWTIYVTTNGVGLSSLAFGTSSATAQLNIATEPGSIVPNRNYHIVVWRKQSEAQLWMLEPSRGHLIHVLAGEGSAVAGWVNVEPFALGSIRRLGEDCDPAYLIDGVMDEVRIFARQRTNTEFDAEFATPISPASDDLVAYWKMDDDRGNAMTDSSAGNHQLTVSGTLDSHYAWVPSPFP